MSSQPPRGRDDTPSPMAAAAAAATDSPPGAAVRVSKRQRTPVPRDADEGSRAPSKELKSLKEDIKKLTKDFESERLKSEATKTEIETWYTFARESRTKSAQHHF